MSMAIVIGATSGVGWYTSLALSKQKTVKINNLILVGRSQTKGDEIKAKCQELNKEITITFLSYDLTLIANCNDLVQKILSISNGRIDILVNSAGVIEMEPVITKENLESSFVVNYLQRFVTTTGLLPAVQKSPNGKILIVSAPSGHWNFNLDLDDLAGEQKVLKGGKLPMTRTAQKCNDIFTFELARRLSASNIDVFEFNPGLIDTGLHKNMGAIGYLLKFVMIFVGKKLENCGDNPAALVCEEKFKGKSGPYSDLNLLHPPESVTDPEIGKKLWEVSMKLSQINK